MTGTLLRAAALATTYLLVVTSIAPGDLLIGMLVGLGLVVGLSPRRRRRPGQVNRTSQVVATGHVIAQIAWAMIRGSWRVVRLCLGAPLQAGLVEIPRSGRSRLNVALWGVLTGQSPDEIVVDVDERRDTLIVHVVGADDPEGVRARHQHAYEHWQRKVVR